MKKCKRCLERDAFCKGFCERCYYATKGKYEINPEQLKKRNYIYKNEGILTDRKGNKWIIDLEDFPRCSKFFWTDNVSGYAKNAKVGYLHKFICPQWKIVDHIDRNPRNNKKNNLRNGGKGINGLNRKAYGISGYKGVSRNHKRWAAKVGKNHLGTFDTIKEAHCAVMKWARIKNMQEFYK